MSIFMSFTANFGSSTQIMTFSLIERTLLNMGTILLPIGLLIEFFPRSVGILHLWQCALFSPALLCMAIASLIWKLLVCLKQQILWIDLIYNLYLKSYNNQLDFLNPFLFMYRNPLKFGWFDFSFNYLNW